MSCILDDAKRAMTCRPSPLLLVILSAVYAQTLIVPSGQVWYINAVRTVLNTTGAAQGLVGNWRCSLWPDREPLPKKLVNHSIRHPV